MKTQYRIVRTNSYFGWQYTIQRRFCFIWIDTFKQSYNKFDFSMAQVILNEIIQHKIDFAARKKAGNSVIINHE